MENEAWVEVAQAIRLGAFDFGIPIGPFDQPDHDSPLGPPGKIDDPINDERTTFAVSLHHEPKSVPARQVGVQR